MIPRAPASLPPRQRPSPGRALSRATARWARRALAAALLAVIAAALPGGWAARARAATAPKTILIDTSERVRGRSPLAPLWTEQLGARYTLRQHGGAQPGAPPGRDQDFRITPALLAGVDLFILTGFDGTITTGDRAGTRELDYSLDNDELAALEAFVRGGGTLLVIPQPRPRPDNTGALLARFGIDYRRADAVALGEQARPDGGTEAAGVRLAATLGGRAYTLTAYWWLYPLRALPADGGTVIAAHDGAPIVAEVAAGAGRVIFLGAHGPADSMGMTGRQLGVATDNPAFFLDLVAHGLGLPALTPAEARRATWEVRVAALQRRIAPEFATSGQTDGQPTQAEWAASLLLAAEHGQRCDLGPGCLPWQITAEQRAFLEARRDEQGALLAAFARLQARVSPGTPLAEADLPAIEGDYATALAVLAADQGQRLAFNDLYRRQGGAVPRYPDEGLGRLLGAIGGMIAVPLAIALLARVATGRIRRGRRVDRA